jgi:hypothetical protein
VDAGMPMEGKYARKFEIRNPKLETIQKFKILMNKTGASTWAFFGLSKSDTPNCLSPCLGTGGRLKKFRNAN